MKKIVILCLAGMFFILEGCKKEKATVPVYPTTHVKLNPAALEFVQLPVGRYFIYKDSATGFTDSVRVILSKLEELFHKGSPGSGCGWLCYDPATPDYYYEQYTLVIGSTFQEWFKVLDNCDNNYSGLTFAMAGHPAILTDSSLNLSDAFWYPLNSDGLRQYSAIPSLTIEGHTYTDVHRFYSTNGLAPTAPFYVSNLFYWVKGIGIIKKESRTFNSIKTSTLVRYG